jgi:hypothetical protein
MIEAEASQENKVYLEEGWYSEEQLEELVKYIQLRVDLLKSHKENK